MRFRGLMIVLLLMLTVLSGCASNSGTANEETLENDQQANSTEAPTNEPVTLTMLMHDALMYEYFTETNPISEV